MFECREIKLQIPSWFLNNTSYFLFTMDNFDDCFTCEDRGLTVSRTDTSAEFCTTTIEGEKCSLKVKFYSLSFKFTKEQWLPKWSIFG